MSNIVKSLFNYYFNTTINVEEVKGICTRCKYKQQQLYKEGIWINGDTKLWACYKCKYGYNGSIINSRCFGNCEWCRSSNIEMFQGNTYNCNNCKKDSEHQPIRPYY